MSCSRCRSSRLYQFEVSPSAQARPGADELPLVCRDCGQITIGGNPVNLPEELEKAARDLAEAQGAEAARAADELEGVDRVELYLKNFFRVAYLEGFFRSLVFFRHNAKEGRLVRLRELWQGGECMAKFAGDQERSRLGRLFTPEAYTEFEQLLHLNAVPGEPNAKSHAHRSPPKQEGHP